MSFKGVIDLSPSDFFPELGLEGTPTEYCKDQAISSMKKQYAFCAYLEILEQIAGL